MAVDLPAMRLLAQQSLSKERLIEQGFRALCSFADLHPHGYTVRHWLRPSDKAHVLAFYPRMADSDLPWMTATDYATQAAIHRAIGVPVVPAGCVFTEERFPLLELLEQKERAG